MAKLSLKRAEQLSRFLSVTSICHGSQTKQKWHFGELGCEHTAEKHFAEIKYMAVTASGVYKHCKSCFGLSNHSQNRNYAVSKTEFVINIVTVKNRDNKVTQQNIISVLNRDRLNANGDLEAAEVELFKTTFTHGGRLLTVKDYVLDSKEKDRGRRALKDDGYGHSGRPLIVKDSILDSLNLAYNHLLKNEGDEARQERFLIPRGPVERTRKKE
ncbi:hypothetical protein LguiB_013285 [Lonicera macranthoides]